MNNPTVIIDGKVQRLFKFQEDVAQKIVSSLNKGYGASINLKTGCGRQVILQRVVDLLSNRNRYQARSAQSILEQQILDTYPTSYNLTTPATPFTMKTKPLTKLQKIKQKAYQEGVEFQAANVEHYRKCLNDEKENNQSLRNQIERLEQRISSFRDTMQAINTISQGTSRL